MENERAVTTEVEAATDESQPASASVHDDSAAAVDGDTLTADEQAASYLSGFGRNSGFRLRNRSVPDIFAGSWVTVTVTVS